VQDVEDALRRQNVELPSGRIESSKREFNIVAATDLQTTRQFEQAIIANVNGYPVRLGDVANVAVGAVNERVIARFKGDPSINMGVVKQATGNPLELSQAVRAEVEKDQQDAAARHEDHRGLRLVGLHRSFDPVRVKTISEAVILVVLVIFFFLRNLRATLIRW